MNLHGIVAGAIGSVNPHVLVTVRHSLGTYRTAADGKRAPDYRQVDNVPAQVQPLSPGEVKHMDNLNIQGVLKKAYFYGEVAGVIRADQKGGDLVVMDGKSWLVVHPLEQWPDWCSVVLCQQL